MTCMTYTACHVDLMRLCTRRRVRRAETEVKRNRLATEAERAETEVKRNRLATETACLSENELETVSC